MADYSESLKACGYRGKPDKENVGRLFTRQECSEMNGIFIERSGECLIKGQNGQPDGSYSWNCGSLNKDPYAIAYGYRWHAGAVLAAAAGLWLYAKRR